MFLRESPGGEGRQPAESALEGGVVFIPHRLPGGGAVTWVRGTNSFTLPEAKGAHFPESLDPRLYFHPEQLSRILLSTFGASFRLEKRTASQKCPIPVVSRRGTPLSRRRFPHARAATRADGRGAHGGRDQRGSAHLMVK
jgi:hypothetical protein